jgi:3',5'-cyclic-AMP phosphodiesterase
LPEGLLAGQPDADPDRWTLLADIHVCENADRVEQGVRPVKNFIAARGEYLALKPRPAGLIVAGDCAFLIGAKGDYTMLAELVQPIRKAGVPLHFALGNHDHRPNFYGAFPEARPAGEPPLIDKHVSILETPRANWFLLDSLQGTNDLPGRLGEVQLQWLAKALDARANRPALIVAHHNPQSTEGRGGLQDFNALLDVLRPRKQVKAYLYGHMHIWSLSQVDGIHLINLPTLVWLWDKTAPQGWVDATLRADGISLTLHTLDKRHAAHGQRVELAWRA